MSLIKNLYNIGKMVDDKEFLSMIKTDFEASDYITLIVDFKVKDNKLLGSPTLSIGSLDNHETFFTKSIGGRGSGYFYLYPNFEYRGEKDLYKKFKNTAPTFEKSVLVFANEENQNLAKPVFEYIKNYDKDELNLKSFEKDNYLLIFTINGKTIKELMPEILTNFSKNTAFLHSKMKPTKSIDFITQKSEICGYNPDVKFFTFDNYHDQFKTQIVDKLPLSQQSASLIKKGWMYVINYLKFYHKGLEYIILPSMLKFNIDTYKTVLNRFKAMSQTKGLQEKASKEDSLIRKLQNQSENLENIGGIYLNIYFTNINIVNLSVEIFGSMEDLLPSKIRDVGNKMLNQKVLDYHSIKNKKEGFLCLSDYFLNISLFANFTKSKGLGNRSLQERIYLAKLLLGYQKIQYNELLDRFENFREFDFENKKKLNDEGIKEWINFSGSFVENEDRTLKFLDSIDAIKRS
ncbi:CRISPR/Cas system-associated protein Cas8, type I-B/HMARI [Campylobacter sputorum bv. paraureolyticus LMG 11764]|uniref:hypothetical protein n=1 Tax=Campylobacter sputorum TaxID=206 RepID=UPI000B78E462|nr:hypothetical protein [Campylobacter sputorum]ASM38379.1 CRISPR/Cas system-associated protein Cas8, type I-B/HMARI [Campylobacter sputorum bv. paraureolyticus LMG 11764]